MCCDAALRLQPGREPQCGRCVGLHSRRRGRVFDLCAQKSGNLVTTRVLPSTGTKKTPPPGPRRPKDPRRKGFASFARVYTSSSAPQCERIGPPGGRFLRSNCALHHCALPLFIILRRPRSGQTSKGTHNHAQVRHHRGAARPRISCHALARARPPPAGRWRALVAGREARLEARQDWTL
jgi:hypothetical protein